MVKWANFLYLFLVTIPHECTLQHMISVTRWIGGNLMRQVFFRPLAGRWNMVFHFIKWTKVWIDDGSAFLESFVESDDSFSVVPSFVFTQTIRHVIHINRNKDSENTQNLPPQIVHQKVILTRIIMFPTITDSIVQFFVLFPDFCLVLRFFSDLMISGHIVVPWFQVFWSINWSPSFAAFLKSVAKLIKWDFSGFLVWINVVVFIPAWNFRFPSATAGSV